MDGKSGLEWLIKQTPAPEMFDWLVLLAIGGLPLVLRCYIDSYVIHTVDWFERETGLECVG